MSPLDLLAASAKKLAVKDQNNDRVIDADEIEAAALEALSRLSRGTLEARGTLEEQVLQTYL